MILRSTLALLALLLLVPAVAAAAAPAPSADELERDRERAIERALDDELIQDKLALRPDDLELQAGLYDFSDSDNEAEQELGTAWVLAWYEEGAPDDEPTMTARVDLEGGTIESGGQTLVVMPGRADTMQTWVGPWWQWTALSAAFAACLFGVFGRGDGVRMLLPLAIAAAAHLVTLLDVVPRSAIRGGNIALFAVALGAMVLGAVVWTRQPMRPARALRPRLPIGAWIVVAIVGIAYQVAGVLRVDKPIDVALASDIGARLMQGGVPVYGNIDDVPGLLSNGDTYGPISYLAYVPGVAISDDRTGAVLWSNVGMGLLAAALLVAVGQRLGNLRAGVWAAAAWCTCPLVAIGIVSGNNDVVVAVTLTLALLLAARPGWRGAMVALAASTKFLPAIVALVLLRLRGEDRAATVRYVVSGLVTLLVVFVIALRGTDALDEFWNHAVEFQVGRDDIGSFWGLTQLAPLRSVFLVGAIALAVLGARRATWNPMHVVAGSVAAVLALTIAGLPQYWGTYATWLVPPVLLAMLWRSADERIGTAGDG